jgi:two-component system chemotaxis sensor kinase CheA
MGLSVVQETARRLQGTVELEPVPGGGTRITLSVPLSIASYRLIVVRCGKQSFAIPMQHIESLRCFTGTDVESAAGAPVLTAGGKSVPLVNLDAMLGVSDIAGPAARHAVILRNGGACVAVAVDAILREADAVVQDVPLAAEFGGAVSSGAILDDGSIALVLDAAAIRPGLARPRPASLNQAAQLPEPEPRPQATILVVDDSLTTRALEKSILEAHGYRVRVAVDGLEALERLRQEPADLVISDIEMPRLDGFGLVHAMKQDTALEKIPVIVVTSVERREDRERGLAAGADAYIVKRRFDQEELLGVIRQVL